MSTTGTPSNVTVSLLCLSSVLLSTSCTSERRRPPPSRFAEIYALADLQMNRARYYKPAEQDVGIDVHLAPLIVQEVLADDLDDCTPDFGRLRCDPQGAPWIDPEQPTIYFQRSLIRWRGRQHEQHLFLWFYEELGLQTPSLCLPYQGLRVIADASGYPSIWQLITARDSAEMLFVSQILEKAATQQYGRPLPGRKHATEPALSDAPQVVVARVLEDGPVPMGPIVYLEAGTRAVGTVICRCMPSQVGEFVDTVHYELRPLAQILDAGCGSQGLASLKLPMLSEGVGDGGRSIQSWSGLRLPQDF